MQLGSLVPNWVIEWCSAGDHWHACIYAAFGDGERVTLLFWHRGIRAVRQSRAIGAVGTPVGLKKTRDGIDEPDRGNTLE